MDDQQAAVAVLQWATKAHCDAVYQETKAFAEARANYAAEEAWDGHNPYDGVGGIGMNPYTRNIDNLNRTADSTLKVQQDWACVKDFVIRRISNLIDDEST